MTQLTITDKLRDMNHDIFRSSDLQSESDLDSIRNSYDVFNRVDIFSDYVL